MRKLFTIIFVHVLGWLLLLLLPYIYTHQAIQAFAPQTESVNYLPVLVVGMINVALFYMNYFLLIPKLFFAKRYLIYILSFGACLAISLGFTILIFRLNGISPDKIEAANPILKLLRPIANSNAVLMLAVSFVTSLALAYSNRLRQTENEKHAAQIASLKSQINPHFLFNTLNNIYASTIDAAPRAAEMVEKLSEMMRYSMRDAQKDFVPVEDEINHISNYIELQRIRLDHRVQLNYQCEGDFSQLEIAPMLLMPFVENAFKHGVNPEQESRISIAITVQNSTLQLQVVNNKVDTQQETSERSGLGIENTKNRLQLIYPTRHQLVIKDGQKEFSVSIQLNLA